jgi:tRNA(Ile)-lysidine synthase TilS/MesJ
MDTLIGERNDASLIAVTIKMNDPDAMEHARAITEAAGIPWVVIPLDNERVKKQPVNRSEATRKSPFHAHKLIEYCMTSNAESQKIDALAMGYTLEDHAEWTLWNAISGAGTPQPGCQAEGRKRVRIIRPFMQIPRQELDLYTRLFLNDYYSKAQAEAGNCMEGPVTAILAQFYRKHPGVPYALVNIGEQVKKFRDQVS